MIDRRFYSYVDTYAEQVVYDGLDKGIALLNLKGLLMLLEYNKHDLAMAESELEEAITILAQGRNYDLDVEDIDT
jgi:hypothetical protein